MWCSEMLVFRTRQAPLPQEQSWMWTPHFHLDMLFDFLSEVGSDP